MISRFPEWSEIALEHRQEFVEFARRENPVVSELSFANLFVWRMANRYKLTILDNVLCVMASPEDREPFFLPPLGSPDPVRISGELLRYGAGAGPRLSMQRVPERLASALRESGHQVELDPNHSDYVYLANDLATLAGRKYSKKRNQISQFRSRYQHEYRRIDSDVIPQCVDLQQRWCDSRDCFTPQNTSLAEENRAIREAMRLYDSVGLIGGAILVEGRVEAFTIGGRLNQDTLSVHFEKGNPDFTGIYQVINQAFCVDVSGGYTYVNREQDLGDPGLRQAKRSYYPHHMVDKYIITLA